MRVSDLSVRKVHFFLGSVRFLEVLLLVSQDTGKTHVVLFADCQNESE